MDDHQPAVNGSDSTAPAGQPPLRVMALHALLYCERLFYLEEVEEILRADAAVYAGRRLHDELAGSADDESPEVKSFEVASEKWGLKGKVDGVRKRDGKWIVREHKRGRCRRGREKEVLPWDSDRLQAVAYAVLLEEAAGEPVREARIRYHRDNVTATVEVDDNARSELTQYIARARQLRASVERPAVTSNEKLCPRCSLAPVCLPEEERLVQLEVEGAKQPKPPALFPANRERQTLHVVSHQSQISRSSESLVVTTEDGGNRIPIEQIDTVLIHGYGQITTQAVHLCAQRGVAVQWMTAGGRFIAGTSASPGRVQQRIRQYAALTDSDTRLRLARQLVHAKIETQLRYLLRATRTDAGARQRCAKAIAQIRKSVKRTPPAGSDARLRGLEGIAARAYFSAIPHLLAGQTPAELHPAGRTKYPPRDRFNCLLSFGYAMIQALSHATNQRSAAGSRCDGTIPYAVVGDAVNWQHQPRPMEHRRRFRTAHGHFPRRPSTPPAASHTACMAHGSRPQKGARAVRTAAGRIAQTPIHRPVANVRADCGTGSPAARKRVDRLRRCFRPDAHEVNHGGQEMASDYLRHPRTEAAASGSEKAGRLRRADSVQRIPLPARLGHSGKTPLELNQILAAEDDLLVIPLCSTCAQKSAGTFHRRPV